MSPTEPDNETPTDLARDLIAWSSSRPLDEPDDEDARKAWKAERKAKGDAHRDRLEEAGGQPYGKFWAFGSEADALAATKAQIEVYLGEDSGQPFSLAVFGPPGCGKSFMVEQLAETLDAGSTRGGRRREFVRSTINLTQITSPADLAAALAGALSKGSDVHIPFVFFDEFDGPCAGRALGWLPWFLAPLNDGRFFFNGVSMPVGRAVFVFAGGTSHTAEAFAGRSDPPFVTAKGPDFASRLMATIDVAGPNAVDVATPDHRRLRRALQLAHQIESLRKAFGRRPVELSDALIEDLLEVDRYTHGSRSLTLAVAAIRRSVSGTAAASTTGVLPIDGDSLPSGAVLRTLLNRGPLDPMLIGGPVQFSGSGRSQSETTMSIWRAVGERLIREGAAIAFGGRLAADASDRYGDHALTLALTKAARSQRAFPASDDPLAHLRIRVYRRPGATAKPDDFEAAGVGVIAVPDPAPALQALGVQSERVRNAIELLRMRVHMARTCRACIVIGGQRPAVTDDPPWTGRMPGLLEEVLIGAMHGRPLYLVGAGGATEMVGALLGLTAFWEGVDPALAHDPIDPEVWAPVAHLLAWPGAVQPPLTVADAIDRLQTYALGGPNWPDNGLTAYENRALFASTCREQATGLIIKGLRAVIDAG